MSNLIPPNAIFIVFLSVKKNFVFLFLLVPMDSNKKNESTTNDYICNKKNGLYSVDEIGCNAILYNCIF